MVIFKFKNNQTYEGYARTKRLMESEVKKGMILLPNDIDVEVIGDNGYQIWTKGEYIRYMLSVGRFRKNRIDKSWQKASKGYNFVIAIYRKHKNEYDIWSVERFNYLLSEEKKEKTLTKIKEEDVNAKEDM